MRDLRQNPGRISVFDLDHTLVVCNSSFWFCTFLYKQKVLSKSAMSKAYWYRLRHDFSSIELEQLHSELFDCLLKGLSLDLLENFMDSFIQNCIFANLYFPAFEELRLAQHCGAHTVIMSSSPSFIVSRVAGALGVDEWLATEYSVDSSRRLSGIKSFIDGNAKARALQDLAQKNNVSLKRVSAFSDSYRDLPFLRLAGDPVAVNPDAKLEEFSMENKWRIL